MKTENSWRIKCLLTRTLNCELIYELGKLTNSKYGIYLIQCQYNFRRIRPYKWHCLSL